MDTVDVVRVKVTRLKGIGYGVRVYVRDKQYAAVTVPTRADVGPAIRAELRMLDKCGVDSPMASASRDRAGRKQLPLVWGEPSIRMGLPMNGD